MRGPLVQLFSTFIISIGNFLHGYSVAWTSDALVVLEGDHSPLGYSISRTEGNLVGSTPMLGSLLGILLTGWVADNIGRKRTLVLCALMFTVSWSTITTAPNVPLLLTARFIIGVANGFIMVVTVPYISEISEPKLRGTCTSISLLLYLFGTLVAYINGWFLNYEVINYFNLVLCVVYVILVCSWKETPAFLMKIGRDKEALESLKFFRGASKATPEILDEFDLIKDEIFSSRENFNKLVATHILEVEEIEDIETNLSAWKTLCTSKPNQRAVVLITLYAMLVVFAGTIAVVAYAGFLFTRAAPGLSPHFCSIVLSLAFIVGCLMTTVVNRFVGRRILMISSSMLSSWFLAVVSSLLRWSWGPEWLVPVSLLGYCASFQMGGLVPLILLAESFKPKVKSLATVIVYSAMCLSNFVVLALFSTTVDTLGLDGTFFLFSLICASTAVILLLTMRETKGKTVDEILDMYSMGYIYCRR